MPGESKASPLESLKKSIEAYRSAVVRSHGGDVKTAVGQDASSNYSIYKRHNYRDSVFAHAIQDIKTKLTELIETAPSAPDDKKADSKPINKEAAQTAINQLCARLDSGLEHQYYTLLMGGDFDLKTFVDKAKADIVKTIENVSDSAIKIDAKNEKDKIIESINKLNTESDAYFQKINTQIKEDAFTKHSETIFRQIIARSNISLADTWTRVGANEEENAEVQRGHYSLKNPLKAGPYRQSGSKATLYLDQLKNDDWQIKLTAGSLSEKDFTNAAMEAVDLLMANGAKIINLSYSEIKPQLCDRYLQHIEWISNGIMDSKPKRDVHFEIDENVIRTMKAHFTDDPKNTAKLESLLKNILEHNKIVASVEEKLKKKPDNESEIVANLAKETNLELVQKQLTNLETLLKTSNSSLPPAQQITADKNAIESLTKSLKIIEQQQWRIEHEFEKAHKQNNETDKDALKEHAAKIKQLSDKTQEAFTSIQTRANAREKELYDLKIPPNDVKQATEKGEEKKLNTSLITDIKKLDESFITFCKQIETAGMALAKETKLTERTPSIGVEHDSKPRLG
jgi:hypothetical protein